MIKYLLTILLVTWAPLASFGSTPAQIPSSQETGDSVEEAAGESQLLGYKEWKRNQVFDARKSLDEFKSPQLSKMAKVEENNSESTTVENSGDNSAGGGAASADNLKNAEGENPISPAEVTPVAEAKNSSESKSPLSIEEKAERLRQLEFNLEIAQGLTIHDYFALYLKSKTKAEMAEAIKKLSPDELSELLMAYRKSLYGVPEVEATQETAFK